LDEAVADLQRALMEATAPARAWVLAHYALCLLGSIAVLFALAGIVWATGDGYGALMILGLTCAAWFLPRVLRRLW